MKVKFIIIAFLVICFQGINAQEVQPTIVLDSSKVKVISPEEQKLIEKAELERKLKEDKLALKEKQRAEKEQKKLEKEQKVLQNHDSIKIL
jgi:hypothetical protein